MQIILPQETEQSCLIWLRYFNLPLLNVVMVCCWLWRFLQEILLLPCPSLTGCRYFRSLCACHFHVSFKELGGTGGVSHSICCLMLSLVHPVHAVATNPAVLKVQIEPCWQSIFNTFVDPRKTLFCSNSFSNRKNCFSFAFLVMKMLCWWGFLYWNSSLLLNIWRGECC